MKKVLLSISAVIVISVAVFAIFKSKSQGIKFTTQPVIKGNIVETVTAVGTVNPVKTVLVGTQVSGTIQEIYVDFNFPVKKGQLIAQIDPATFESEVERARANLLSAKANLDKARATLLNAKRTMDRNKELFLKNLISQTELETSETNHETSKADLNASTAQVAQAEALLKNAETNLKYTRIISPVNGIVVSRNVDVGQTVAASFQTPTLFTIAEDLTKMQIDANVDEADIGKVKLGQKVEFTVDAYPNITFNGKVSQLRIAPIIVQNVVTYDVVIILNNPEFKLKPGMTANVSIIITEKKDILKIPNAALRFKLPETEKIKQQKGLGVWVIENRKPKRIPVSIGISDGDYAELIKGDLKEADELIVESLIKTKATPSVPRMF